MQALEGMQGKALFAKGDTLKGLTHEKATNVNIFFLLNALMALQQ
jgi:hypothetical protein